MNHITRVVTQIQGFLGPDNGTLLVELQAGRNYWHFTPDEAIAFVRENPRLEFSATEKWSLY